MPSIVLDNLFAIDDTQFVLYTVHLVNYTCQYMGWVLQERMYVQNDTVYCVLYLWVWDEFYNKPVLNIILCTVNYTSEYGMSSTTSQYSI